MENINNMARIVFLCSGGGGNLRFIKQAIDNGWLSHSSLVAVLTDRKCEANEYARLCNIDNKCADFSQPDQKELIEWLDFYQPDIVITTVHRILCSVIVDKYRGKLINLHYSLLPAFGGYIGAQPVKKAISYGAQFTGVTVHLVDESLDSGKPLVQAVIPLRSSENIDDIMDLVFRCGCISLVSAIKCLCNDQSDQCSIENVVRIKDRNCMFGHVINLPDEIYNEIFWQKIRSPK